jgi:hypothetical protein
MIFPFSRVIYRFQITIIIRKYIDHKKKWRLSFFSSHSFSSLQPPELYLFHRIRLIHTSSDAREEFQVVAGILTHSVHLEMSRKTAPSSQSLHHPQQYVPIVCALPWQSMRVLPHPVKVFVCSTIPGSVQLPA